jgi:hypothetical protein
MTRLLAVALLVSPFAAQAYVLRLDNEGHTVNWVTAPTFVIDPSIETTLDAPGAIDAAQAAAATYAADLPQLDIAFQVAPTLPLGFDAAAGATNQNSIVPCTGPWTYDADAIAVTLLTIDPDTHAILDADIVLNTTTHQFRALPADSVPGGASDDLQNTLTHELGHAMGMAHNTTDATVVMYPGAPKGQITKRTLTPDDEAGLAFLYNGITVSSPEAPHGVGCAAVPGMETGLALLLVRLLAARQTRKTRL